MPEKSLLYFRRFSNFGLVGRQFSILLIPIFVKFFFTTFRYPVGTPVFDSGTGCVASRPVVGKLPQMIGSTFFCFCLSFHTVVCIAQRACAVV